MSEGASAAKRPALTQLSVGALLIVGVGLIAYGGALDAPFTYDDENNITLNRGIRWDSGEASPGLAGWSSGWSSNWERLRLWQPTPRPVANASFAANYAAGGLEVSGYRAVNIAVHLLASLGVAWLSWLAIGGLTRRSAAGPSAANDGDLGIRGEAELRLGLAVFAGLVFVAHPLATQSVTYVVQRMTSLSTLFYVAALCTWIAANRRPAASTSEFGAGARARLRWRGVAVGLWLLAMGSKEIAATWPIAVWLWEWQVERSGAASRVFARRSVPWALGFGALAAVAVWAYAGGDPFGGYSRKPFTLGERLWTEPRVWWSYVGLALAPLPSRLSLIHDIEMSRGLFSPWTTALAIGAWLVALGGALRAWGRTPASTAFGALVVWWLLQQVVEGTVLPLEPVYEHRTYLPMVALCALGPWALWSALGREWPSRAATKRLSLATAALVVAALTTATVLRNQVWRDNVALWQDAARKAPLRAVSHANLGVALLAAGRLDEAGAALREATRLEPNEHVAHQNLGSLAVGEGRFADAEPHFRAALAIEAADPISIAGLGAIAMEDGRPGEAIDLHRRSLAIRVDPRVQTNLGQIFLVQGDFEAARRELQASLRIEPRQPTAWRKLADASEALASFDEAAYALETLASQVPEVWTEEGFAPRLAALHERAGRSTHARRVLEAAAAIARERGRAAEAAQLDARAAQLAGAADVPE